MRTAHVLPVNDLRAHVETGADCWCEPRLIYVDEHDAEVSPDRATGRVIVHEALDGRD